MTGSRKLKVYAIALLAIESYQILYPNITLALTTGPSQPEMQQFTPIGSSDMVDLFTGDFNYNIPLLDVEGFPINIAYQSGITMDQEASWCGLGWNINPGNISRNVRGIPDDFDGEKVSQSQNIKTNWTVGVKAAADLEALGVDTKSLLANDQLSLEIFYNSYRKFGLSYGYSILAAGSGKNNSWLGSLSLTSGNQSGLDIQGSLGIGNKISELQDNYISIGSGFNSRQGMQYLNLNAYYKNDQLATKSTNEDEKQKKDTEHSYSPGASFSFVHPAFYPNSDMPESNYAFNFTVKGGPEANGFFTNGEVSGYYYQESLQKKHVDFKSYGIMYSDDGVRDDSALLDIAREKDIPVRDNSVSLAIPYATFDVFNVQGHDVGGSYHVVRNDLGRYYDPYTIVHGANVSAGLEFGIALGAHFGANLNVSIPTTKTCEWTDNNHFNNVSNFGSNDGSTLYEPFYFKNVGEMPIDSNTLFSKMGGTYPSRVEIAKMGLFDSQTHAKLISIHDNGSQSGYSITSDLHRVGRAKRQQVFSYLDAYDASYFGLDKYILNYPLNKLVYKSCSSIGGAVDSIPRTNRNKQQISEITITKGDGSRYVYGIPAYNNYQKEATFDVEGETVTAGNTLVHYTSTECSTDNNKGKDNYFTSKVIPAYAHSYLLTAVLSPDYVDNTGDGITSDDKGNAYKINYTKVHNNYRWRTPIESNEASYQEGMKSVTYDDKGSIVYGGKEIWYIHSIESRNFVAQFILSKRDDGLGVDDEFGGTDTNDTLMKLDRIDLYSKADLINYGDDAVPIKSVHFEYDYSLCQGVPNQKESGEGKLTLKSIYFTYGRSARGKLNVYRFHYDDSGSEYDNPDYDESGHDRWGNFSSHDSLYSSLSASDFPYTIQRKTLADKFAAAWTLRKIELPSGGTINVYYESDDYAYVQNKRACQMFLIDGFSAGPEDSPQGKLYDVNSDFYFLHITLPKYVHSTEEFHDLYLEGLDKLYFKCLVDVTNLGDNEYVSGYSGWDGYGINLSSDSTNEAWLKLSQMHVGNETELYQPVAYSAWQYLRLNLPEKAYPGSDLSDGASTLDYLWSVLSILPNLYQTIVGFNGYAHQNHKGSKVDVSKSFVRLDNPTYKKFGGGVRVKKLTLSDNWNTMVSGDEGSNYGQEYSYTTQKILSSGDTLTISSGVASYEPIIGGEENPFREPLPYEEKTFLGPSNFYYSELPYGESLYPAPVVGYSEITVRNLHYDEVKRTATGYTVSKFYTAKDFPVSSRATDLLPIRVKPDPILKILNISIKDYYTGSQGFAVELNDMHGKPKSEEIYNELGAMISGKYYYYKVDDAEAPSKHLNNECDVVYPDGSIGTETIGLDYEAYEDMRQQETNVYGGGANINVDVLFFLIVIPVPTVYPTFSDSHTRFRSSATTKLMKRYGVLDSVVAEENGSRITTENLLYDSETGEPLLTRVNNEFEDTIYNFNYPAHWIYSRMGPAYKNIGGYFKNVHIVNGELTESSLEQYFIPGDEIAVFFADHGVAKIYAANPTGSQLVFLDSKGELFSFPDTGVGTNAIDLKIIRSGNRNESIISAGSVASMKDPVNSGTNTIDYSSATDVLNAQSAVYSENWKMNDIEYSSECDTSDSPDATCLIAFLDSLFSNGLETATADDGVLVSDITNGSTACESAGSESLGEVSYYYTSGISGTGLFYNNGTETIPGYDDSAIVELPVFYTFEAMMGPCHLYFVNRCGHLLPVGDYYTFTSAGAGFPDGAVKATYASSSPDPVSGFPHDNELAGYFYVQCVDCNRECESIVPDDVLNPYVTNARGAWRPFKTYTYNDLRTPLVSTYATNIEENGTFDSFSPFYTYNTSTDQWDVDSTTGNWVWATESTIYDRHGNEIENNNALNIKSTALYGYNGSLPKAVVNNSGLNQAAYDNFEDYSFKIGCFDRCDRDHWDFSEEVDDHNVFLNDSIAHTGNYSLLIKPGKSAEVVRTTGIDPGDVLSTTGNKYKAASGFKVTDFSPTTGDYLFSGWVLVDTACQCSTYVEPYVHISFYGDAATYDLQSSGPIIEGWQRIQGKFSVPGDADSIRVKLVADSGDNTFFDDLRIHPYKANMKSFAYDERTLRLMGELDENNYATFYEYDEEGNLIRVKRETERGVMTIQEGRTRFVPNN